MRRRKGCEGKEVLNADRYPARSTHTTVSPDTARTEVKVSLLSDEAVVSSAPLSSPRPPLRRFETAHAPAEEEFFEQKQVAQCEKVRAIVNGVFAQFTAIKLSTDGRQSTSLIINLSDEQARQLAIAAALYIKSLFPLGYKNIDIVSFQSPAFLPEKVELGDCISVSYKLYEVDGRVTEGNFLLTRVTNNKVEVSYTDKPGDIIIDCQSFSVLTSHELMVETPSGSERQTGGYRQVKFNPQGGIEFYRIGGAHTPSVSMPSYAAFFKPVVTVDLTAQTPRGVREEPRAIHAVKEDLMAYLLLASSSN